MTRSPTTIFRVDRAAFGQRIDVDRLDPAVGGVVKYLGDAGARSRTGDDEIDVGGDERRLDVAVVLALEQQGAGAHLAGRHEYGHGFGRRTLCGCLRRSGQKCRNCNEI
jgi:hypothetical protein